MILVFGEVCWFVLQCNEAPFGWRQLLDAGCFGLSIEGFEMLEDLVFEGEQVGEGIFLLASYMMGMIYF